MFDNEFDYNLLNSMSTEEEEICLQYPLPITVKSAEGCYLIDENNNKYLDLTSNRENQPLGYSTKINIDSIPAFFDSGLFNSAEAMNLEKKLAELTGLEKAVFTTSQFDSYRIANHIIKSCLNKTQKNKILISSNLKNKNNFLINEIDTEFIPLNNSTVAKSVFTKSVGAAIIELFQTDSEINIATTEYLSHIQALCNKNNAVFVLDISSISPLRLGNDFLNFDSEIKPDIIIISKGLTQGIPFGAVITSNKAIPEKPENIASESLSLAYSFASRFINDSRQLDLKNIINSNSKYIEKSLNELAQKHISIVDTQSYGMLFTILFDLSAYDLAKQCLEKGIIVEALNPKTIKLSPPYNIGKEEIDKLVNTLDELLDKIAKFDRLK